MGMFHSLIDVSLWAVMSLDPSAALRPEALAWDKRQEEIENLSQTMNKIMKRNSRVVRRGNENPYVESLIVSAARKTQQKMNRQNLFVMRAAADGLGSEKFTPLTALDFQRMFLKMDPYRREFAEGALVEKGILGTLLLGKSLQWKSLPKEIENEIFLDLEKTKSTGDRKLDERLHEVVKRSGPQFFVLILPKFQLPDAGYVSTEMFAVEQVRDGSLNVYQERRRPRQSNMMAAQIITDAPRNLLFVRKPDLRQPLTKDTRISAYVVDNFDDPNTATPVQAP